MRHRTALKRCIQRLQKDVMHGTRLRYLVVVWAPLAGCAGDGSGGMSTSPPPAALALTLQQVVAGLDSPLFLTAPANDSRLFIVERPGRIRIVRNGTLLATPFLDVHDRTTTDGERGLLSVAFHPQYAQNGFFYADFTDLNGNISIERFSVSASNPDVADPASELQILSISHPTFNNHNGGLVSFGLDGFLYIGVGDGGGSGDPSKNGQNTNTLLGKLLRIDLDAQGVRYAVPPSNPFFGRAGKLGEIWAYGLRNPWRYSFDSPSGSIYIADVGQDRREEIDVSTAAAAGVNYGWSSMEGTLCFPADPCSTVGLTPPVLDYDHSNGCSIIGGYVYRGAAVPEAQGRFFYSDLCGGWLKSFNYASGAVTEQKDRGIQNVGQILSFGKDAQGELYMLSANGSVYRIIRM